MMLFGFELQTAEWGLNMMTTGAFTLREAERRAKQVRQAEPHVGGKAWHQDTRMWRALACGRFVVRE
jgi:hypothetical protein